MVEELPKILKEIKQDAIGNKIPIMLDDGLEFLVSFIVNRGIKTILEVGTGVGYSAIMMAISVPDVKIVTIEKDKDRYLEALNNIKKMKLEDRIILIFNDALDCKLKDKFELIFIDAAKSKNLEIFNHFERNLLPTGAVITDNISFHGYVNKNPNEISNRNLRGLIKKIRGYILFLKNNDMYKTTFYDIGDGISVTERK